MFTCKCSINGYRYFTTGGKTKCLIKDTTKEERKQIVEESLGNIAANCDGCMSGLADMYQDYIDGKKEIRDINMEFNARYVRGDMDKEEKRSCPI